MKLRIRDNALRLRLTVSEVARVAAGESVEGRMPLPGTAPFAYRLVAGDAPDAALDGNTLRVSFPAAALRDWARGDDVSLTGHCGTDGEPLALLVEKDFACLSPRAGGDDDDTFDHPQGDIGTC